MINCYFIVLQCTSFSRLIISDNWKFVFQVMSLFSGRTKGIFQKGVKYPEKIQEFSKSSTSVMLSGSASGVLLPPDVVYRSKNLYKDWCIGGIPGSVYNCSKSGWFDLEIFTDWFKRIFLPHARYFSY